MSVMTLIDFFLEPLADQKPKDRSCSGLTDSNALTSGSAAFHCWPWHTRSILCWGLTRRITALLRWGSWHEADVRHQCGLLSGLLFLLFFPYSYSTRVYWKFFDISSIVYLQCSGFSSSIFWLFKLRYLLLWSICCTVTSEFLEFSFSLIDCSMWNVMFGKLSVCVLITGSSPMVTSHIL